jgi:hypothetical protein
MSEHRVAIEEAASVVPAVAHMRSPTGPLGGCLGGIFGSSGHNIEPNMGANAGLFCADLA